MAYAIVAPRLRRGFQLSLSARAAVAAVSALVALAAVPAAAQADRISIGAAERIWYDSNYAGACGAGATFYCAQKTSWDCAEPYGAMSRFCVGYYVRGPGWPVTSKTRCKATGFVNYSNRDYLSNVCWA